MNKKDFILGCFIGLILAFFGTFISVYALTKQNFISDFELLKQQGILGKVITLGAILNIVAFFILLKINKEFMAKGIILSLFIITIYTIFI